MSFSSLARRAVDAARFAAVSALAYMAFYVFIAAVACSYDAPIAKELSR